MAWQAVGKRRYYFRYRWHQGRAIRQYVGTASDPVTLLIAAEHQRRREQRAVEAAVWQDEQIRCATAAAPLLAFCRSTDVLVRAALLEAGYRQHDRGEWRLHRDHRRDSENMSAAPGPNSRAAE